MKGPSLKFLKILLCFSFVLTLLYPCAASAERCEQWVAKVVSVQGTVEVKKAGEALWQPVNLNDTYCPGDEIRAQENSRADLALINQAVLRLNQNTSMTLREFKEEKTSLVDLFKGAAHFFSRKPRSLEVNTPYAIAGVRGTEFFVEVSENQTFLSIFEGEVLAQNKYGELTLTSGQSGVAEEGKPPVYRVVVHPRDAVQWALYYPPVIYGKVAEDNNDPRYLAYRAQELLAVGRVDEANTYIERALRLEPNNSDALSMQAIIAVVQNDKEKALSFAQKAVEANPNSATPLIALSYAQQASFNLEGARASLEKAVQVEPGNALAWARLSEIQAGFGVLDKSLESAKKAESLDPNLSRTQTVLGFAYLREVKIKESKEAFEKAIKFDQADPLPRLGLGLAKIRDGNLDEGGRDIEIAASLDPNNSIIRSYLGKTYYEEKKTKLDGPEYKIAKELDPKDPTPYFYDAIRLQTTNRPVEALQDYQKAIELNDNRAVYRSKLELDSDEAARQSALARIYSNLGFEQLALVEGWKSVNTDPTNYSAHRFLADSYAAIPRHEVARVSELLQSQLLQPENITPIQPTLVQSNLFLISAQGPGALSFNEFNPIFNRNGITVQGSGLAGNKDTYAGEGVVSGIYKKLSFSGGYTYFDTNGWRENADDRDKIADVFAQYELTYKTSIQAEYRYRDTRYGDLHLRFFEDDYFPGQINTENVDTYRVGMRHSWSPSSITLASFIYSDSDAEVKDDQPTLAPGFITQFDIRGPEKAYNAELQHLFRSQYFDFTAGAGYADVDSHADFVLNTILGVSKDRTDFDLKHYNVYGYSYIKPLENLTFTVGASGDFTRADSPDTSDKNKFNPKFGITWNPVPSTTLRGAVFKVLKRTLAVDQTLEPTQVAGFNQFFDDFDGTEVWNYGVAWDQKLPKNIYLGWEGTYRDIETPFIDFAGNARESNWDEYSSRTYLFFTPHDWLALRAEYQYEYIKRQRSLTDGLVHMSTHRVPLGANFFHPSGLSASAQATYYYQDGRFERIDGSFKNGNDDFWLVDAAISYRLPKRYGFLSVGVSNLFDEKFEYYDLDWRNASIQPDRFYFAKITLALP
jgi:tetratricopeptide (TPR) repeat protein